MDVEESNISDMEIEIQDEQWVFVDVQGYKVNKNRFMCKEFCMISDDETFHAIVKSWLPYNKLLSCYKRQIDWTTKYLHGLTYDCVTCIFANWQTLGVEKINWIKYIFRKHGDIICRNIEDLDYEMNQTNESVIVCDYHNARYGWSPCKCALSNALTLQDISNKNAPIRFF